MGLFYEKLFFWSLSSCLLVSTTFDYCFSHLRASNLVRTSISVFFLLNDYSLSGHRKVTCEEHRFSEDFM